MNTDSKVLHAKNIPQVNPVSASMEEFLRVPGIRRVGTQKILAMRKAVMDETPPS